jgi:dihydrofolate reductase
LAFTRRFKELTTGNTIVMGRRTYESIGRPLPKLIHNLFNGGNYGLEYNQKTNLYKNMK